MNEGWATFWHYTIINELYENELVNNSFMVEFLHNHTNVIYQAPFDNPGFNGINPYTLGFNIFQDIRRICESPTEEDATWFPNLVNTDWVKAVDFAMRNYKDESFIAQYLSPKVIRDLKLFVVLSDANKNDLEITHIHDETSYQKIRDLLSQQYNISMTEPNIQVYNVDKRRDKSLTLHHIQRNGMLLDKNDLTEVVKHLYKIWGFPVKVETLNETNESIFSYQCPEPTTQPQTNSNSNS